MTNQLRFYIRFLLGVDAYAALGEDFLKVGKVKDISLGGLAFEYLNGEQTPAEGRLDLNLFLTSDAFQIPDLNCRIIYDIPTRPVDRQVDGTMRKHRCGIRFLSLSAFHKDQLNLFIQDHAIGVAP